MSVEKTKTEEERGERRAVAQWQCILIGTSKEVGVGVGAWGSETGLMYINTQVVDSTLV